jgi:hypothetical protein
MRNGIFQAEKMAMNAAFCEFGEVAAPGSLSDYYLAASDCVVNLPATDKPASVRRG